MWTQPKTAFVFTCGFAQNVNMLHIADIFCVLYIIITLIFNSAMLSFQFLHVVLPCRHFKVRRLIMGYLELTCYLHNMVVSDLLICICKSSMCVSLIGIALYRSVFCVAMAVSHRSASYSGTFGVSVEVCCAPPSSQGMWETRLLISAAISDQ